MLQELQLASRKLEYNGAPAIIIPSDKLTVSLVPAKVNPLCTSAYQRNPTSAPDIRSGCREIKRFRLVTKRTGRGGTDLHTVHICGLGVAPRFFRSQACSYISFSLLIPSALRRAIFPQKRSTIPFSPSLFWGMAGSKEASSLAGHHSISEFEAPSKYVKESSYTEASDKLHGEREPNDTNTIAIPECLGLECAKHKDSFIEKHWRRRHLIQYMTLCWCFFLEGWNDGSPGPLLPRIQSEYNVSTLDILLAK